MSEHTFYERPETIRGHKCIRLKSGRLLTFWDVVRALDSTHTDLYRNFSRAFKLATDDDLEFLDLRIDRVDEHMAALREYLEKKCGYKTQRERIALLRNTKGRTPEEAQLFRQKADELERRLDDNA